MESYLPGRGRPELRHLAEIVDSFDALDLAAKPLAEPRAALAHARQLDLAAKQRPAQFANVAGSVARRLALAELTVDEAIDEVAGVQSQAAAVGQVKDTLTTAAAMALGDARNVFAAHGEALIGALDAAVRKVSRDAGKHAPAVDGLSSDGDAMRAGGKAASAWSALGDLARRLEAIQALADDLRAYRIAAVERHDEMTPVPVEMHYRNPVVAIEVGKQRHEPVPRLCAMLAAEPREATQLEWVSDWGRLSDAYDDHEAKQRGEEAEQRLADRRRAAAARAAAEDRAARRDAEWEQAHPAGDLPAPQEMPDHAA